MYSEAERLRQLKPRTLEWSRVVGANERGHVRAIKGLLGRDAVKSPKFNFRGVTEDDRVFTETAVAFEDLTAALLKTQATQVDSRGILAALVSLHSVEARHAAWIRHIAGIVPAADAIDEPTSKARVVALGRLHELRHVEAEDQGKAATQVHGVRRARRTRRSELGAALALAGVLIGVAVAVVLLEGSAGPSSAEPRLPASPRSALDAEERSARPALRSRSGRRCARRSPPE